MLEGGYDVNALGRCVVLTLQTMLGQHVQAAGVTLSRPEPDLRPLVERLRQSHPLLKE